MSAIPVAVGPGCGQQRFVTPLPDRLGVTDPWGDVLLTLTRGFSKRKDEHVDTAQTFGMSSIGDQALIRGTDIRSLKAAYSIRHMLAITFLPGGYTATPVRTKAEGFRRIPGTDWYFPVDAIGVVRTAEPRTVDRAIRDAIRNDSLPPGARTLGGLVLSSKLREGYDMDGGYYQFADEEYLHLEVDEDGAVIMWSAKVGADGAASLVDDLLGHPEPDCHGFLVTVSGDGSDLSSPSVLDAARERPDDFHLFSVGYDDCIVAWRRAQVKMRNGQVRHIEMSYSAEDVNPQILRRLMARSATPAVVSALARGGNDLIQSLIDPETRGTRTAR